MVRAPADWRSILRRAEVLVRRRDPRSLDVLLPALRWRSQKARDRAVLILARLGPIAVPPLLAKLEDARTATERSGGRGGARPDRGFPGRRPTHPRIGGSCDDGPTDVDGRIAPARSDGRRAEHRASLGGPVRWSSRDRRGGPREIRGSSSGARSPPRAPRCAMVRARGVRDGARTDWRSAGHPRAREGDARSSQIRRAGRGRGIALVASVIA